MARSRSITLPELRDRKKESRFPAILINHEFTGSEALLGHRDADEKKHQRVDQRTDRKKYIIGSDGKHNQKYPPPHQDLTEIIRMPGVYAQFAVSRTPQNQIAIRSGSASGRKVSRKTQVADTMIIGATLQ